MLAHLKTDCHYRLPPRSVQAIAAVLVSAAHPNIAASFDFLHDHTKVGRLSAKEFYNVVAL